ncbi:MAG: hypothetical protein WB808_10655 [Candidatus Dormiibacterota bacterium]
MATEACPSIAATTCGEMPSSRASVAAVCRKAWKWTGRMPARRRIAAQRVQNDEAGMGSPSDPGQTSSPRRCVRSNASTATSGSLRER